MRKPLRRLEPNRSSSQPAGGRGVGGHPSFHLWHHPVGHAWPPCPCEVAAQEGHDVVPAVPAAAPLGLFLTLSFLSASVPRPTPRGAKVRTQRQRVPNACGDAPGPSRQHPPPASVPTTPVMTVMAPITSSGPEPVTLRGQVPPGAAGGRRQKARCRMPARFRNTRM